MTNEAKSGHIELVERIQRAGVKWKREAAWVGVMRVFAPTLFLLSVLLVLEALYDVPVVLRVCGLAATVVFLAWGSLAWIARPLFRALDPIALASEIERAFPHLGERLESSAELWNKRGVGRHGYSVELIDALVVRTVAEAAGVDFGVALRPGERTRVARVAALLAIAAAVGVAALGARRGPALERLFHPLAVADRPALRMVVDPGDTKLVSGDDLSVMVTFEGPFAEPPVLSFAFDSESPSTKEMHAREGEASSFEAVLRDVRTDLEYWAQSAGTSSPAYRVTVLERPYVTGIRLDYDYPSYSALLPKTVEENNGDIAALAGTRVTVNVSSSKSLERAQLVFGPGQRVVARRLGDREFEAVLTVESDSSYSIEIEDRDGLSNPDPPTYSVTAIRDERPLVTIVEPGEDVDAPRGMVLPVVISAIDDYGVSSLSLFYSLEGSADATVIRLEDAGAGGSREFVRETAWDLSETGLLPGRTLVYYAEVVDNDLIGGPKAARSKSYVVRFPSMSELYSDVTGEHDDILDDIDAMLEEQQVLREQFEGMQEEIRSEQSLEWQERERVEEALDQQENIADEVAETADRLSDLADSMSETDRVALETLEKVEEITRLLDEVADKEMRDLIDQIREAMERVSPEDVSRAMETMSATQDDYLKRLEQTLNLLKRVKAEQQLADAAARAENLAAREERVASEASRSPGESQCQQLAREQERIRQETEELLADIARAAEEMREVDPSAASEMESAATAMEACDIASKMKRAGEQLSESEPAKAAASCKSAADDLLALFTRLSSCQSGMSCSLQSRDREATLRAVGELLGVSSEQEAVVEAVKGRKRIPRPELVELVAKEADLVEAMSDIADRMFQVSKESFVIDPAVYRAFGIVQMSMTRAASHIADGGSAAGQKEARAALGSVNSLIMSLLTSSQNPSGSSGSAMEQLMQQLQQMSEQQSSLNQMTEELQRQMEQSGMSDGLDSQLTEMRARQEQLLQEARRLAREFGDRREILGRLDDTADEMAKTLDEMERSGASQETIDRQKRILSRLLDAQRSMRRRDYTRERRSRQGEDYRTADPEGLPEDVERATQELREDLLRAMQRGYPAEYRDLIRAYFDGLTDDTVEAGEESP